MDDLSIAERGVLKFPIIIVLPISPFRSVSICLIYLGTLILGVYIFTIVISFFFKFFLILFIYLWLCWVLASARGLSPAAASGGHSSLQCTGLSLSRPLLLRSTGSKRAGSAIVAHGPSRSTACGIFWDQGSNPCPPHWQADAQPLRHQGSPCYIFLIY